MPPLLANRIGILASAFGADARDVPRLARLAGFSGLLYDLSLGQPDLFSLSLSGQREFLRLLSQQEQPLVGLQLPLGRGAFTLGADVDHQLRQLSRAMELIAGLRAGVLCVDLGLLPRVHRAAPARKAIRPDEAGLIIIPTSVAQPPAIVEMPVAQDPAFAAQVNNALAEIAAAADRFGTTVAFSSSLSSLSSLHAAIEAVGCPWFGIDLDPVAVLRDDLSLEQILSLLGGLVRHVRVKDAAVGEEHRTKEAIVGRGDLKWRELLKGLDQAGYGGAMTVDPVGLPDPGNAARAALSHLKSIEN